MLAIAILAAGKGTRMKSRLPKVLHQIAGMSLLERLLKSCSQLNPERYLLIVGQKAEAVMEEMSHNKAIEFIQQKEQKGTGHAIQQLIPVLKDFKGELLVLNGDVPLIQPSTIKQLINKHHTNKADVTLLSAKVCNPEGYGRVECSQGNVVNRIIEERECNEKERQNNLINGGVYCFNWQKLTEILPKLTSKNNQNEIYITDTIAMLNKSMHLELDDPMEITGVNNRAEMAICEGDIQNHLRSYWMKKGVTFTDPSSCTISENCIFGCDVIIEPQTHIRGQCNIGEGCKLGPGTFIENSDLGKDVKVVYSVISNSKISNNVSVGPFAHLRPNTTVDNNCQIGNFVEIKNSNIGEGSKVNHLSYLGDAKIGEKVNIGAGTITANFDGAKKHPTFIGKESKTGANSVLVAPISIGTNVTIGAGSTLTKDVPDGALAVERSKQINKDDWQLPKKPHK